METKDTADSFWLVTHCVRSHNDGYKSVLMITVHQVASHHYTEMWRWSCVMLDATCKNAVIEEFPAKGKQWRLRHNNIRLQKLCLKKRRNAFDASELWEGGQMKLSVLLVLLSRQTWLWFLGGSLVGSAYLTFQTISPKWMAGQRSNDDGPPQMSMGASSTSL